MITRANMEVGVSRVTNAHHNARGDVARPNTTSPACFSVRSAAGNACVYPRGIMVIRLCALATTTGRPRKEDPSALELQHELLLSYIFIISFIVPFKALAYFPTTILHGLTKWYSPLWWLYDICFLMHFGMSSL